MNHTRAVDLTYPNIGKWFLLLIVLVFAGFYRTYFAILFDPKTPIIHFHFVMMSLWVAMVIAQPFLIKYKKNSLHRMIGRISYVVIPVTILSAYLVSHHAYFKYLEDISRESPELRPEQLRQMGAAAFALPAIYLFSLIIFYSLAVINRRRSAAHARYMVAAGLTVLGPSVDRIFPFVLGINIFPLNIPVETFAFVLIDTILIVLLWKDYAGQRSFKPMLVSLTIYLATQIFYFTCADTGSWEYFTSFIMRAGGKG